MNKIITACFIILHFLILNITYAQEIIENENKRNKFIGLEIGIDPLFCMTPQFDFIRGDLLPFSSGAVSETLKGQMLKEYLGVKCEFRNKTNNLGLLLGLRFSILDATLGKNEYFNSTSNYFYLLDNQSGTTTEYFRINQIDRKINYLGIPVEIRWIPASARSFKFYMKLGTELDIKINSSSKVDFHNSSMADNQDLVLEKFKKPGLFYSAIYASAGFNLGKKPNIDLELILPYILLTPKMSGILTSNAGMGIKIEIRLPY